MRVVLAAKPRKLAFPRFAAAAARMSARDSFMLNVARVLSGAPPSLNMTHEEAAELLRKYGSVRRATRAARRIAVRNNDATVCVPVPDSGEVVFKNLRHATNSCYIASTLVACFAQWDAWDALLAPADGVPERVRKLRNITRCIVNTIRKGDTVSWREVESFRGAIVNLGFPSGRHQEDATHLFASLVDLLGAPLLPFGESLLHEALRDDGDERMVVERFLWLTLDSVANGSGPSTDSVRFEHLLEAFFFGEQRTGIRRSMPDRKAIVNAWCVRLLLPEYAPSDGTNDRFRRNSFDTIALPFALKRFDGQLRKRRTRVLLPTTVDFTRFVSAANAGDQYSLQLKSVVCHIGQRIGHGHYVAYTFDGRWRRWDDTSNGPALICDASKFDSLPVNQSFREEILRDSYMVFYELVPGDGSAHPGDLLESAGITQFSRQNRHLYDELHDFFNAIIANADDGVSDEIIAREFQNQCDADYAATQNSLTYDREVQRLSDAQFAARLSRQAGFETLPAHYNHTSPPTYHRDASFRTNSDAPDDSDSSTCGSRPSSP